MLVSDSVQMTAVNQHPSDRRRKIISILIFLVSIFGLVSAFVGTVIYPFCSGMKRSFVAHICWPLFSCFNSYAQDHDGNFPCKTIDGDEFTNSNQAFRELFRSGILDHEGWLFVRGSAWHGGLAKPDFRSIGTVETNFAEAAAKYENHWAYVSGLNSKTSDPNTPLFMDGFSEKIGEWSEDSTKKGGIWERKFAIIVTVSGSVKQVKLDKEGRPMEWVNGKWINLLDLIPKTPGVKILNPDG